VTPRRGVALTPMETRRDVIVRAAVLADELGYEIFALPEGWGLDAGPVLTEIALRTGRINLASSVLSIWGRTPATLAMSAATLHQVSGGRYVLGLGTSTKALAEGFHDTAFEHPAAKLRDVVTKVRALLDGQPAQLSHAPAARPLRLGQPPAPEVPIWVAALGQHTTRVAAELGDGRIPGPALADGELEQILGARRNRNQGDRRRNCGDQRGPASVMDHGALPAQRTLTRSRRPTQPTSALAPMARTNTTISIAYMRGISNNV